MTACQLAQLIGKLHATLPAVPPAPLFYLSLQRDLQKAQDSSNQDYDTLLSISPPAQEELRWWQEKLSQYNGKPLIHRTATVIIRSDASLQG